MNPFSWLSARRRERLRRQRDAVWARREIEAIVAEIQGWGTR